MVRLKLGYYDVKAVNPQIVYVGAMGFGPRGRYAGRPAYDDMVQGMAGLPAFAARASGGEPRYSPSAYADRLGAVFVSNAVLGALYHRKATGQGQRVDVPMFEHVVYALLGEHLAGETFVPARGPMGHGRSMARDRRPYRTKDGYLCTLIYNDRHWRAFFEMIGVPERYESDARFSSHSSRMRNLDVVFGYLSAVLQTRTTAEWTRLFMERDLPVAPMNDPEQVIADPHLADTGFFRQFEHPTEGISRTMQLPVDYSGTPLTTRYPAPCLGEHTVELLTEGGYDRKRIDELLARGIAIAAPPAAAGSAA